MQTRDGEVKVVPQLLCCTQCVFERCHFYSQVNGLYAHFVLHSSKFQYNSEIAFVVFATYLENTYFFLATDGCHGITAWSVGLCDSNFSSHLPTTAIHLHRTLASSWGILIFPITSNGCQMATDQYLNE